MGNALRKVISKCVLFLNKRPIADDLAPYQFGAGAALGTETIIHMVESVLELEPTYVVVKVDFKNAFNTIFRAKLLTAIKNRVPGMHMWAAKNHIGKTFLWHKCTEADQVECDSILSEEGVQQGEVCGPTNFCLVLQELIVETNALLQSLGGGYLWGYMDDLTLLAPLGVVESIWPEFVRKAADIGLEVNMSKCVLYTRDIVAPEVAVQMPTTMIRSEDGFEMTGLNYFTRLSNPTSATLQLLSVEMDDALCGGLSTLLKKHPLTTSSKFWQQARLAARHVAYSSLALKHISQSGCSHGDRRFKTHDAVRDTWRDMGNEAGLRSHTESSDLLRVANVKRTKKRMDVVMECYEGALPLLGDISVVD
eukprot:gene37699-46509_t